MSDIWKPEFKDEDGEPAEGNPVEAVFQAVGAASVCWDNMNDAGVFQTERAIAIAEGLIDYLRAHPLPNFDPNAGVSKDPNPLLRNAD